MRSASLGRQRGAGLCAVAALGLTIGAWTIQSARADEGAHEPVGAAERLQKGVAVIQSRALFRANCAGCHGKRGRGVAAGGTDFSDPQALIQLSQHRMQATLTGSHESLLPAELSDDERTAIIGYVRNYLMLPAPDADTEKGRAIYSRNCSVCHGDRGNSASWAKNSLNPAPADFTSHGLDELSRSEMIDTVTFGEDGTAMVAFAVQLSRKEIAATVDYIREAFMPEKGTGQHASHGHGDRDDHATESSSHSDHATESVQGHHGTGVGHQQDADAHADASRFPDGLVGDPVWGKAFYNANCAECHGEEGDGKGPRAYFMIVKPKDFQSRAAKAELTREELFEHISEGVIGTTMPAWAKVLDSQQIANVGEYVYRAFLHAEEYSDNSPTAPVWRPSGTSETGSSKIN